MKTTIQPKSILQLVKENPDLFWNQDWYKTEKFAKTKPKKRTIHISEVPESRNKTYGEQVKLLKKGEDVPTANEVLQAMIQHYKETGEKLDWWIKTSDVSSRGPRVSVRFYDGRLSVHSHFFLGFLGVIIALLSRQTIQLLFHSRGGRRYELYRGLPKHPTRP